jgi:hypothetical protein
MLAYGGQGGCDHLRIVGWFSGRGSMLIRQTSCCSRLLIEGTVQFFYKLRNLGMIQLHTKFLSDDTPWSRRNRGYRAVFHLGLGRLNGHTLLDCSALKALMQAPNSATGWARLHAPFPSKRAHMGGQREW